MDNEIIILLQAISTLCFFFGTFIVNGFKKSLEKLQMSVDSLNNTITELVVKDAQKDEKLVELKEEFKEFKARYHDKCNNFHATLGSLEIKILKLKQDLEE